jgi:hypothetical protein
MAKQVPKTKPFTKMIKKSNMFKKIGRLVDKTRSKLNPKSPPPPSKLPPTATLIGLPRELRQQILLSTYKGPYTGHMADLDPNRFIDHFLLREQHIKSWTNTLRLMHPIICSDMDWVERQWLKRLKEIQYDMECEMHYVWANILWKDQWDLTPEQIVWAQTYRREYIELGVRAEKMAWESRHGVLKWIRKCWGLRRWIGVDDRSREVEKHTWCYLKLAWEVMIGDEDESAISSTSSF